MGSALVMQRPFECRLNTDGLSCSTRPGSLRLEECDKTAIQCAVSKHRSVLRVFNYTKVRDRKTPPAFRGPVPKFYKYFQIQKQCGAQILAKQPEQKYKGEATVCPRGRGRGGGAQISDIKQRLSEFKIRWLFHQTIQKNIFRPLEVSFSLNY